LTAKPANGVTTDSDAGSGPPLPVETPVPASPKFSAASVSEPYRQLIETGLAQGRNAMSLWQEMVDRHGFRGGCESVKRFVRKLRGHTSPEARAVITTEPGEEAQVDYGTGPTIRDPSSGKYRHSRLFVMTLGYSRKCVRLLTFHSSTRIWAELHERAFRKLGGAVKIVVPDNLREGVLKPDIYDATLNPLYRDVLAHYGAVAVPCRVADPDRKGKVESGVGHAQKTPLKGQRFESLQEAQAYLDQWEERWADTRIHGATKRQVAAMFAEEKPALLPLPLEPFRYYQYRERSVHLDGCVEVEAAYYSAPPGWIGRKVQVQWDGKWCGCSIRETANCCASTCVVSVAAIASKKKIVRSAPLSVLYNCWRAWPRRARASANSRNSCMSSKANWPCGASRVSYRSRKSMASPAWKMPAPLRWNYKPSR
jgi:transposase